MEIERRVQNAPVYLAFYIFPSVCQVGVKLFLVEDTYAGADDLFIQGNAGKDANFWVSERCVDCKVRPGWTEFNPVT